MKQTLFILLWAAIVFCANGIYAQTQMVCNGKKITIDEKTTFVFNSKFQFSYGYLLNGKAVYLPEPEYPKAAKEKKLGGVVNVQVSIDKQGNVVSASAVSGYDLLRPPAVEAALKARFKKLIANCQPKEYTGVITYNFTGLDENKNSQNNLLEKAAVGNNLKQINLKDITKKAIYLPQPRVPFNVQFPQNEVVQVRVILDVSSGKVIEAKAISGLQKLRPFAEEVARCARFTKSDLQANVAAYITYKFDDSNKSSMADSNGGVMNSRAISLPQPVLPADTNFSGTIAVHVDLDEEGSVISAKPVSAQLCISWAAVEAAKKAKFTKTFLSGKPVRVSGVVVYKIPLKQ